MSKKIYLPSPSSSDDNAKWIHVEKRSGNHVQVLCKGAFIGTDLDYVENVRMCVEGGIITSIEEEREPSGWNHVVMPAVINAHIHVGDSFAKDAGFNLPLEKLVAPPDGLKHRLLASTPAAMVQSGMGNSIKEMASCGTGKFLDFREGGLDGLRLLEGAVSSTPGGQLMARALVRPGPVAGEIENMAAACENSSLAIGLNESSPGKLTADMMQAIDDCMGKNPELLFGTHVAETAANPAKMIAKHGMTGTSWVLQHLGHHRENVILVHCNHVSPDDMDVIEETGASVVLCPRTASLFHNVDLTRCVYREFLEREIPVALGTDNVMINAPDMFKEMDFMIRLLKMGGERPDHQIDPRAALRLATVNGAGILKSKVAIEKGGEANFIILDGNSPALRHATDMALAITMRAGPVDIISTVNSGKILHGKKNNG